ncbi:MAG: TPM domain-containing protein [Ferruginibacter sp.]
MKISMLVFSLAIAIGSTAQLQKYIPPKPAFPRLYNDENAYAYYHSAWRVIEDKLIRHHKKTGNQIVITTIATTGGYLINELATATFRNWGIGDKKTNTGLLVLIARKEKQIGIETGYGLEGQVTDLGSAVIIRDILEPGLDSFNFLMIPRHPTQGYLPTINKVADTLISLTEKINTTSLENAARQTKSKRFSRQVIMFACTFLLLIIYLLYKKYRNEKK